MLALTSLKHTTGRTRLWVSDSQLRIVIEFLLHSVWEVYHLWWSPTKIWWFLQTFYLDARGLDWTKYFENYCLGTKRFVLNEDLDNLPQARQHLRRYVSRKKCTLLVLRTSQNSTSTYARRVHPSVASELCTVHQFCSSSVIFVYPDLKYEHAAKSTFKTCGVTWWWKCRTKTLWRAAIKDVPPTKMLKLPSVASLIVAFYHKFLF